MRPLYFLFYSMLAVTFTAVVKEERVINTNKALSVMFVILMPLAGSIRMRRSNGNYMQACIYNCTL